MQKIIAIIVSLVDPAGVNIKKCLIDQGFKETGDSFEGSQVYAFSGARLYTLKDESIHAEHLDTVIKADVFIFATKHQSSQGVLSLSVHAPGNWGNADMGGKARTLCVAPASLMKEGLLALASLSQGFEVTVEQTHHGPSLATPCMFIEIGSGISQWSDPEAGAVIAKAILRLLSGIPDYPSAVMLGGGHYNHEANKVLLETDYAIGHICAKHNLADLDEKMLLEAMEKTSDKAKVVILDWKGLGTEKSRIVGMLEDLGIPFARSKDIRNTEKKEIKK